MKRGPAYGPRPDMSIVSTSNGKAGVQTAAGEAFASICVFAPRERTGTGGAFASTSDAAASVRTATGGKFASTSDAAASVWTATGGAFASTSDAAASVRTAGQRRRSECKDCRPTALPG